MAYRDRRQGSSTRLSVLLLAATLSCLWLPTTAATEAQPGCYARCYRVARPCFGRTDCNRRSGGCYDRCDRRDQPAPALPPAPIRWRLAGLFRGAGVWL